MENEKYTIRHMAFVLKGVGFFLMLFGWFTIFKHFVILPKSGRGDSTLKKLISQFSEFWSKGFCISLKYKSIIP